MSKSKIISKSGTCEVPIDPGDPTSKVLTPYCVLTTQKTKTKKKKNSLKSFTNNLKSFTEDGFDVDYFRCDTGNTLTPLDIFNNIWSYNNKTKNLEESERQKIFSFTKKYLAYIYTAFSDSVSSNDKKKLTKLMIKISPDIICDKKISFNYTKSQINTCIYGTLKDSKTLKKSIENGKNVCICKDEELLLINAFTIIEKEFKKIDKKKQTEITDVVDKQFKIKVPDKTFNLSKHVIKNLIGLGKLILIERRELELNSGKKRLNKFISELSSVENIMILKILCSDHTTTQKKLTKKKGGYRKIKINRTKYKKKMVGSGFLWRNRWAIAKIVGSLIVAGIIIGCTFGLATPALAAAEMVSLGTLVGIKSVAVGAIGVLEVTARQIMVGNKMKGNKMKGNVNRMGNGMDTVTNIMFPHSTNSTRRRKKSIGMTPIPKNVWLEIFMK